MDAFEIFGDVAGFANAINATTEEELDKAGEHLAAIAKIGIDAVMTLLTKRVADKISDDVVNKQSSNSLDDVDNTSSNNVDLENPETTSSRQIDENANAGNTVNELSSSNRSSKMSSAAKSGVDPSDYSVKVGTVRMKEHPNYQNLISEVEGKGYKIVEDGEARVSYVQVINKKKEVIAVEKELHVSPDMRYIDLEHEVGHIRQLERFEGEVYTDRYKQSNDGRRKLYNQNALHVLQEWQDIATEYHNRLDEFLRLYERNASPELLSEHSSVENEGIGYWYRLYNDKIFNKGRGSKKTNWVKEFFPDLGELQSRYNKAIEVLKQTYLDIRF